MVGRSFQLRKAYFMQGDDFKYKERKLGMLLEHRKDSPQMSLTRSNGPYKNGDTSKSNLKP
jgi:hypothetical protein